MYIYIHVSLCLFQPAILSDWHCQEALDIQKKNQTQTNQTRIQKLSNIAYKHGSWLYKKNILSSKQIEIEIEIDW